MFLKADFIYQQMVLKPLHLPYSVSWTSVLYVIEPKFSLFCNVKPFLMPSVRIRYVVIVWKVELFQRVGGMGGGGVNHPI